MNITKVLAEEVANKMVEPLEKKINLLHDEQVRITEEVIRKSIPQESPTVFKSSGLISLLHIASHCLTVPMKNVLPD